MQMDGVTRREAIQTAVTGAALLTAAPAFAQRAPGGGYPVKKKEVKMKNGNFAPVVSDGAGCELNSVLPRFDSTLCSENLYHHCTDHHLRPPWLH